MTVKHTLLTSMENLKHPPYFSAGIVCIALGLFAWTDFLQEVNGGDLDLTNFETILFPIGIALVQPGKLWQWIARIQLFALALFSGIILVGFLFMSDETKFLVFDFDKTGGYLSGAGPVLFMHGLFFAGILWVYFSMFVHRKPETDSFDIQNN